MSIEVQDSSNKTTGSHCSDVKVTYKDSCA